ncbi:MAG: shikimate kinase [Bacteroidales bacterium]|nr:shikimate kinase [Bacteroidales bacterium]
MAGGKSTLGKRLSDRLGCPLHDTDNEVEKRLGMSVSEIFSRFGQSRFREEERAVLHSLPPVGIVVTGGGLPCFHNNMAYMNSMGVTLYVDVPAHEIVSRLRDRQERSSRPLLKGLTDRQISRFVEDGLRERAPFYEQAAYRFRPQQESFDSLCALVRDILSP